MNMTKEVNNKGLTPYGKHTQVTDQLRETYLKKNQDYGDSFNKSLNEDGLLVAKIRLMDKMSRFSSLIKSGDILVKDESIEDTLMDMANYAIMTVMWMRDNGIVLKDNHPEEGSTIYLADVGPYLEKVNPTFNPGDPVIINLPGFSNRVYEIDEVVDEALDYYTVKGCEWVYRGSQLILVKPQEVK